MNVALFVDLSNFYGNLLKSNVDKPRALKDYFLSWLEFDLLAKALHPRVSYPTIWIFYSKARIGPSTYRIERTPLNEYIDRINRLAGVTTCDVEIPGKQRERVKYKCEKCKHSNVTDSKTEKGVDASLTVHLFDTMDSWDVAYLLSGDADFVPAVASLRRRGKVIIGAGFPDSASSALVRECYDYIDLCDVFLREDAAAYKILRPGGIAERWLIDQVLPTDSPDVTPEVQLCCEWRPDDSNVSRGCQVILSTRDPIDLSGRHKQIEDFHVHFPRQVKLDKAEKGEYWFRFSWPVSESIKRKLKRIGTSIDNLQFTRGQTGGILHFAKYQYNLKKKRYELTAD